jgi:peptide deformylase
MALLDILHFPDSRLRNRASSVVHVDASVRKLVEDMLETMYAAPGIGLAAVQINVPLRVITLDLSPDASEPVALINPQVLETRGALSTEEGCLSVPGFYDVVERAEWIRYAALDLNGNRYEAEAQDLLAVCVQHEIDHLDGRLFVDYLSQLKRQRIRKKLEKQQRDDN